MRVIITPAARADLVAIRSYLSQQSPGAAQRIGRRLLGACRSLNAFPSRGSPGRVSGTREIMTIRPYVIVYRERAGEVQILRIWHGAQDRSGDGASA